MQYRVHLTYYRPSGTTSSVFYTVEARSPSWAIVLAKAQAKSEPLRKIQSWSKCSAGPLSDPPPFVAAPRPVEAGETITVPVSPITGVLEHTSDPDIIKVGGVRMRTGTVEAILGRKIAPKPPKVTVQYYALYPSQVCYGSDRPIRNSSYDLDQLVQVKVTRHDGKIVNKEIV